MTDGHTFIAYAREDSEFVLDLADDLRARGLVVWLDADIPPGADWDRVIDESLRRCGRVLIVLSPESVASAEVRGELRSALNLGKPVLPLLLRPCEIPRQLQNVQYLDFSLNSHDEQRRGELASTLQAIAPVGEGAFPHLAGRPPRHRRDLLDDVRSEAAARLAQSLRAAPLNIPKERQPEQVTRWSADVKLQDPRPSPVARDVTITEIFDDAATAGKLLILGAPGSGKTTALLELTQALISRAEADDTSPVPVLCNLSSWRDDGRPLADWMVEQLKTKYGVRTDHGRAWLRDRWLAPLFDGLDEAAPGDQEPCVRAINRFLEDVRPRQIVVCCRLAEYENYQDRLQLNGAIRLLPLPDDEIERYMVRAGCGEFWQRLSPDRDAVELARSPLLLGVMTKAFGTRAGDWPGPGLASGGQTELFDVYVRRLLSQGAAVRRYSNARTVSWLAWLAQTMKEWGQAEFQIEHLQPTLLQPGALRIFYRAVVMISAAAAFVLAEAVNLSLTELIPDGAVSTAFHNKLKSVGQNAAWEHRNLILMILLGLATGVVLASRQRIQPIETLVWSRAKAWREMKSGLRTFAVGGLNYLAFAGAVIGLLAGATVARRSLPVETLEPELTRWGVAASAAAAVVLVALMISVGIAVKPHARPNSPMSWRREQWRDATLAGLALAAAVWPRAGGPVAVGAGATLMLVLGRSRNLNVLSPVRFRNALVTALIVASGCGAANWWFLGISGFAGWVVLFLDGSTAIALTAALLGGWFTRRGDADAHHHAPGSESGWLRRWSRGWLVAAIVGPVLGLLVGVIAQAGGRSLVQGVLLMTSWSGVVLTHALALSLTFGAMAGGLGLLMGGFLGALVGLLRGLTGPVVGRRTVPNQGIRQSARNVGLFAMIGVLLIGVPYAIVNLIVNAAWLGIWPDIWDWLNLGLGASLLVGIIAGFVPGAACIQHFALRFVLWCCGLAPWRYARFLNDATERMFLQRVGGRYRFIHDLLRDHFAGRRLGSVSD